MTGQGRQQQELDETRESQEVSLQQFHQLAVPPWWAFFGHDPERGKIEAH